MRRVVLIVFSCIAGATLAAGCGAEGVTSPAPKTVIGTVAQQQEAETPAFKLKGDAAAGKGVFAKAGCGGCHTLKAAGTTGNVGPVLDDVKPTYLVATARVTNGKGVMPSFKGQLSDQEIADVAAFVVTSTGGTVP